MFCVATIPDVGFPKINNNSPFERQIAVIQKFKNVIKSPLMSWDEIKRLGVDSNYCDFLQNAYESFKKDNYHPDFTDKYIPIKNLLFSCEIHTFLQKSIHPIAYRNIGFYARDHITPIFEGAELSIRTAFSDAIYGAELLKTQNRVVVIPCHPGHHAYKHYKGYCYLNNSYYAKLYLSKEYRVGLIDLDYHAGDGVVGMNNCVSVHMDPQYDYPFASHPDLDNRFTFGPHCSIEHYMTIVNKAINSFGELDIIVIAVGFDTYKGDPEVQNDMRTTIDIVDYYKIGQLFKKFNKVLVIQEGGYSDKVGEMMEQFVNGIGF